MVSSEEYYDAIAEGYDALHKEEQLRKIQFILDEGILRETDKLLDVGCGTGFSLDIFPVSESVGVEPSQKLIEQYDGRKTILKLPAESLPFPDNSFDVVVSLTAIQNFDDVRRGLEEIRRVGKKRFALTILKSLPKIHFIEETLRDVFKDFEIKKVEEAKDFIFFITSV